MCVEVHNLDTKKTACTVKELADMLNVDLFLLNECRHELYESADIALDCCLCQLDVFKVCDKIGIKATYNNVYDIEISKNE